MYFCGFNKNIIAFYVIILVFQLFCIFYDKIDDGSKRDLSTFVLKVLAYRSGLIPVCMLCVLDRDPMNFLQNVTNTYGSNTAFGTIVLDVYGLVFSLAPSYRVKAFQVVLTIYIWHAGLKIDERLILNTNLFKNLRYLSGIAFICYCIVLAAPSLKDQEYQNGWDKAACSLSITFIIAVFLCIFLKYCTEKLREYYKR